MNDNELNNNDFEEIRVPFEERNDDFSDVDNNRELPFPDPDEENEPQEGLTFKWVNLIIGVGFCVALGSSMFSTDWAFYLYLFVVVIIHEMGHVIAGKSFGCFVKEMQVFFLPFVSYKPHQDLGGSSWRDIKWSLGVIPLGGVTVFKSRASDGGNYMDCVDSSPFIEDKPAWQRLLISAAGVLLNIVTFLILYLAMPYMSDGCYDLCRPLAVLSLLLAVLNILPVYPLDGGAILFALYEILTGKKPSEGFTRTCAWIGFIFIILFFWMFPEWLSGIIERVFGWFF